MEKLQQSLKIAFASEYSFYLKAQNFHWNVVGPFFVQMHELFGNIYEEVGDSIDPFAENIRKLGAYVPASFARFSMLTQVQDENEIIDDGDMVQELLSDSDRMVKVLKLCFDIATAQGEDGLANFLAERMDAHRKHSWMLRSVITQ
jgi:starvation-inducible DNA-binding protein